MKTFLTLFATLLLPFSCSALELDVQRYAAHSQVQWCWAVLTLDQIPLKGDERILDVGCSYGRITALMASKTRGLVLGLDPNRDALDLAEVLFPVENTPHLHWYEGTASTLNAPASFDLITSFCSLNWITDKEAFFADAARLLSDEGRLAIILPAPPAPQSIAILRQAIPDATWDAYRAVVSKAEASLKLEDYVAMAKKAGFKTVWAREVTTSALFRDPEEMGEWLLAIRGDLRRLSKEDFQAYLAGFTHMVQAIYPQPGDGRVYVFPKKWELLFVKE